MAASVVDSNQPAAHCEEFSRPKNWVERQNAVIGFDRVSC